MAIAYMYTGTLKTIWSFLCFNFALGVNFLMFNMFRAYKFNYQDLGQHNLNIAKYCFVYIYIYDFIILYVTCINILMFISFAVSRFILILQTSNLYEPMSENRDL